MRKASLLVAGMCLCALLAAAAFAQAPPAQGTQTQSWNGSLVDSACKESNPTQDCRASGTTSSFGIYTSENKLLKFDQKGNDMAKAELQKAGTSAPSAVRVTGTLQGDTIQVASLNLN
jgi:hypothetical protein